MSIKNAQVYALIPHSVEKNCKKKIDHPFKHNFFDTLRVDEFYSSHICL